LRIISFVVVDAEIANFPAEFNKLFVLKKELQEVLVLVV